MGLIERLVAFVGALANHGVAEELVAAEDVLSGLLVIVHGPVAAVFFEIGGRGVGEVLGRKCGVLVQRNQVFGIGELLVDVVVSVVSLVSAVIAAVTVSAVSGG